MAYEMPATAREFLRRLGQRLPSSLHFSFSVIQIYFLCGQSKPRALGKAYVWLSSIFIPRLQRGTLLLECELVI